MHVFHVLKSAESNIAVRIPAKRDSTLKRVTEDCGMKGTLAHGQGEGNQQGVVKYQWKLLPFLGLKGKGGAVTGKSESRSRRPPQELWGEVGRAAAKPQTKNRFLSSGRTVPPALSSSAHSSHWPNLTVIQRIRGTWMVQSMKPIVEAESRSGEANGDYPV